MKKKVIIMVLVIIFIIILWLFVSRAKTMQIFVRTLFNGDITLETQSIDSIGLIKKQVESKEKIPTTAFELVYGGKKLESNQTLQNYNIQKDAILNMIMNKFTVETVYNNGTVNSNASEFEYDKLVLLEAVADEEYLFLSWSSNDVEITDASNPNLSFTMPASNVKITAEFIRVGNIK